ncbi:hypothetical protein HZA38_03395 [Candidatus Peregrinibacteria bacterium]|nr:hypothetical protein [Candidatus Peregrinibacteria bacterium]
MSLEIRCSARYLKIAGRHFDKITEEYDLPCYWIRLKVIAKGRAHNGCLGYINDLWRKSGRHVRGFDQLVMSWLSDPPIDKSRAENILQQHYRVNIASGQNELAGLIHVKLPSSERNPNLPIPPNNIPPEKYPEILINKSQNEPEYSSKVHSLSYGIYYFKVFVTDVEGNKVKKIFKVWAFPSSKKCKIRKARFYERMLLAFKSILPAQ